MLTLAPESEAATVDSSAPFAGSPALPKTKVIKGCEMAGWVQDTGIESIEAASSALSVKADEALTQVLQQIDGSKKRMIWLVNGCTRLDHLRAILAAASPCSRVVNVLRPDAERLQAIAGTATSLGPLQEDRFFLVTAGTPSEQVLRVNSLIDVDHYVGWKPVLLPTTHPAAILHLQLFYRELTAYLNQKAVTRMTKIASSHLFLANALVNGVFANRLNDIEIYKDIHKNKPALIVATGPSLNKQLDLLEKYKDLFLIIAVDPAVPILKKRGIVPHFVLSIDPKKRPYWKQNELDDKTTFVIDIGCCPDVAWSNNKKYLITSCHSEVHRIITELGGHASRLMTGGSVSTNAFNLAHYMGANPIVLIGQDLAWTDGKDHADGYVSQYSREILEARRAKGFEIPGYDGKPVQTERQLLYYKTWFEMRIKQIQDTLIINATEGGAMIEGALHIPFENVCTEILASKIDCVFEDPALPWQPDIDYLDKYALNLNGLIIKLEDLRTKLIKVIEQIKKSKKDPKKSLMKKIDDVNSILKDGDHTVKMTVEMFGQARVAATEHKILSDGIHSSMKSVTEAYRDIYQAALTGCNLALQYLKKVNITIQELKEYRNFKQETLISNNLHRWLIDGERNNQAI